LLKRYRAISRPALVILGRLGLSDASQLRVALLMPDDTHEALWEMNLPVPSLTLLSPFKTAKQLHLPFIPYAGDPYSDLLFAGWLAQKRKARLPLMPPEIRIARETNFIKKPVCAWQ